MFKLFTKATLPPSLKIPKFVQGFAKVSYFFSDKLTVLFAAKLFTTPIGFKTPEREVAMEESSQKKTLKVSAINKEIHILSYGFSDKKILLSHGWAGRRTQLYTLANTLLEKGYMVISFDGPAHGKSTGKTTNLIEYIETVKAIDQAYGPFDAAIGHSFGSMAILNAEAQNKIFKCLITVGSGDKLSEIINNFANNLGLHDVFGNKLQKHLEKKWQVQLDDSAASNAAKDVKIPVLVVHDIIDGDVHVSSALNIRQNLEKGVLYITNGLGHSKILRDKTVTNKIVDFIIQHR